MEIAAKELKAISDEVKECTETLKTSYNDVRTAFGMLEPNLLDTIQKIRAFRQNITIEFNKSLKEMQDVRKFFLEKDYKEEVERLERFATIAERIKVLMDDGTLEAISDVMLKLSVKKGDPDGRT